MTGAMDSVLGVKKEIALERFLTMMPNKLEVAGKNVWLQGVVIDCDGKTGTCRSIERINERMDQ
jgi:calcineurin-like phosphoesterase